MAWTKYQAFVIVLLIVTGVINTIATKWANISEAIGSDGKEPRYFEHPFLQACFMFLGEIFCIVAFKILYSYYRRKHDGSEDEMKLIKGNRTFNQLVLLPPALCDMIAASMNYTGLIFTYAASFQMLRGSVLVFVGLFSMCFLKRKLGLQEWGGILLVIIGLVLVGLSDLLSPQSNIAVKSYSTKNIVIGDLVIVTAQIVSATQMVLEEKYVAGLDIPALQAVGWEGMFGFTILSLLLIPFYFIPVPAMFNASPRNVLEDAIDGFVQMYNNQVILRANLVSIACIAFYNFAGISVTKELSATTRKLLDSIRTLFIWMFTLGIGWQEFYWLQIIGFIIIVTGTLVYFADLRRICHRKKDQETSADQENLPSAGNQEVEDIPLIKKQEIVPLSKQQDSPADKSDKEQS